MNFLGEYEYHDFSYSSCMLSVKPEDPEREKKIKELVLSECRKVGFFLSSFFHAATQKYYKKLIDERKNKLPGKCKSCTNQESCTLLRIFYLTNESMQDIKEKIVKWFLEELNKKA